MTVTYFKRLRMEIELGNWLPRPDLPEGYSWKGWEAGLVGVHAEVKYQSFHSELDSQVFPCLGDRSGCLRLMREIQKKDGFLADATWLIFCGSEPCATIQGILSPDGVGSIQNVGVVTGHRRKNLGRALVLQALSGFRQNGARKARLEVTADNLGAVKLYRAVGFRTAKTLYKASGW